MSGMFIINLSYYLGSSFIFRRDCVGFLNTIVLIRHLYRAFGTVVRFGDDGFFSITFFNLMLTAAVP